MYATYKAVCVGHPYGKLQRRTGEEMGSPPTRIINFLLMGWKQDRQASEGVMEFIVRKPRSATKR
jgi:hypothetical protein